MASHYLQYIYVGFNGFRWPVAHYGSHNVNGHSIYLTVWPLIDELANYGFNVTFMSNLKMLGFINIWLQIHMIPHTM